MKLLVGLTLVSSFLFTACSSEEKKNKAPVTAVVPTMSAEQVGRETASWPEGHKQIIRELTVKYGQPNESTSDQMIWNNNGPWLRTVVKRDDMKNPLEQTAKFDVPPEKMGDVALFNKAVVVDSTSDHVTSSAYKEDLNFLALNLTKEIVNGNMSPMEARRQYSQLTDVTEKSRYLKGLESTQGTGGSSSLETQEAEESKTP